MSLVAGGSSRTPLGEPARHGRDAFQVSPFTRLARVHAASSAGDVMLTVALAGSLFFSIDPSQARWRVALYLILTLAPFAVVAPLIGPAIDRARGGSRWVITGTCATRILVAFLMVRHLDGLVLFPLAFLSLVMSKGYSVAKSAYVPATVRSDTELVRANSKLALLAALAAPIGALPAGLTSWLFGSPAVVVLSLGPFVAATVLSLRLPAIAPWSLAAQTAPGRRRAAAPPPTPPTPEGDVPPPDVADHRPGGLNGGSAAPADFEVDPDEPVDTPTAVQGLWLAVSTMGLLRGVVGFLTFLLAFELRTKGGSTAAYGFVLVAAGLGNLAGSALAPQLRRLIKENEMLVACLATTAVAAIVAAMTGGLGGALLVVGTVGVTAATAKLAFDSLVQRDAPAADKGRLLAQFEARFQILWVVGAFIPVVVPLPARLGYAGLGVLAAAATASYLLGRRSLGSVVGEWARGPVLGGRVVAPPEPTEPPTSRAVGEDVAPRRWNPR